MNKLISIFAFLIPMALLGQGVGIRSQNGLGTNLLVNTSLMLGQSNSPFVLAIGNNGVSNIFGPFSGSNYIQDAFNSLPKGGPTYGPLAAGGRLLFSEHYHFYTNQLIFSNQFPAGITLEGGDYLGTKLVYAGSAHHISTILFKSGVNPNVGSISRAQTISLRNIGFSAIINTTNILVTASNYSAFSADHCNFTGWQIMTNQSNGSGVSIVDNADTIGGLPTPGLVGLKLVGGLDLNANLDDLRFAGLATGIDASGDHFNAKNITGSFIGVDGSLAAANMWNATYPYSMGAVILRQGGLGNSSWTYVFGYRSAGAYAQVNSSVVDSIYKLSTESLTTFSVAGDGIPAALYDSANFSPIIKQINGPNSSFTAQANYQVANVQNPYSVLSYLDAAGAILGSTPFAVLVHIGGTNSLSVDVDRNIVAGVGSVFTGNGFGLTNLGTLNINTNDFVINQFYTNSNQRAYVSASIGLETVGGTAQCSLYLDQDGNGTFEQIGITTFIQATQNLTNNISGWLQPNARFVFTNLSVGGASTIKVNPGSCQWVKQ